MTCLDTEDLGSRGADPLMSFRVRIVPEPEKTHGKRCSHSQESTCPECGATVGGVSIPRVACDSRIMLNKAFCCAM